MPEEGGGIGELLTTILVKTDVPHPPLNSVAFTLSATKAPVVLIQRNDGIVDLRTTEDLDREKYPDLSEFSVTVTANLQSTIVIEFGLLIGDINDNGPKFGQQLYPVDLIEGSSAGNEVITITAFDPDVIPNNEVDMFISAGNEEGWFEIVSFRDPSGDLVQGKAVIKIVRDGLDSDTEPSVYSFVVTAVDSNIPSMTDNSTVVITVTDANDNPPTFSAATYSGTVIEEDPDAAVLGVTLITSDRDKSHGVSSISLSGEGSSLFIVDIRTGIVRISRKLDRESDDTSYSLIATVADTGGLTATATLSIQLLDINDHTPIFAESTYTIDLPESTTVNSDVIGLVASDEDQVGSNNSRISYTLIQDGDWFRIPNLAVGNIVLNEVVDWDTGDRNFTIFVVATDNGLSLLALSHFYVSCVQKLDFSSQYQLSNSHTFWCYIQ